MMTEGEKKKTDALWQIRRIITQQLPKYDNFPADEIPTEKLNEIEILVVHALEHYFTPSTDDVDTCRRCGRNFRDGVHTRWESK